jgi:hypothetical protein
MRILIYSIFGLITFQIQAQLSEPGYPSSLFSEISLENLELLRLPSFDNDSLDAQDTCRTCGEFYSINIKSVFDFWEKASLDLVNRNGEVIEIYRLKIKSPTAQGLHVVFKHFELMGDEQMFIYSPTDRNRILGAYTANSNKPDFSFISNIIYGNELIIEINKHHQEVDTIKGKLIIEKFLYVHKNRSRFELSLSCHNDVICSPWYNEWCNEIRSVVKFLGFSTDSENGFLCSGAVVNTLGPNFEPVILTAQHCVENADRPENWVVWFNFQSNSCGPTNNGNDLMTISGVDVIASDKGVGCPDIALLRCRDGIPLQYNVFHSGWSRLNLTTPQDGVGIHHPRGDLKKISFGEIKNPAFRTCYRVDWSDGTTEQGSSGSPLFGTSHLITAALSHGPDPSCDDLGQDWYSRIEKSWNDLQPHLAPDNDEVFALVGNDPISACQDVINLNRKFFPGNDWQVKNEITIQASTQINISNIAPTAFEHSPYNSPRFNSDYVILAGDRITIFPGFRINRPDRTLGSPNYDFNFYPEGNQNRVSFQIHPCEPFIDDCGVNHAEARIDPNTNGGSGTNHKSSFDMIDGLQVKLFPNPTNGSTTVTIESASNIKNIIVLNSLGQTIDLVSDTSNENKNRLTISEVKTGVYYILITDATQKQTTRKLIVN